MEDVYDDTYGKMIMHGWCWLIMVEVPVGIRTEEHDRPAGRLYTDINTISTSYIPPSMQISIYTVKMRLFIVARTGSQHHVSPLF